MTREQEWKRVCRLGDLARKGRIPGKVYDDAERAYFDKYPKNIEPMRRWYHLPAAARMWNQDAREVEHG